MILRHKLHIGQSLKFTGYLVMESRVSPDPEKVATIANFQVPVNVLELRSFLGLARQLGQFIPDLSQVTASLQWLLKKNTAYQWLEAHQKDFETIKRILMATSIPSC